MADSIFYTADSILFLCMCLSCIYLFLFAWRATVKRTTKYPDTEQQNRFVILLPSGSEIGHQTFPDHLYTYVFFDDLFQAVSNLDENQCDIVIILGETRHTSPNLLKIINNAYYSGSLVMQLHPVIEERSTSKIRRQAIKEEIRNSIFKSGHVKNGLSSVLDKTDFAIDTKWLKKNMKSNKTNLESRLLQQNIFIDYLEEARVYSATARPKPRSMSKRKAISKLPVTLLEANWDYADKLFRQIIPSWKTLLIITSVGCLICSFYDWTVSIKWWGLLFGVLLTISLAIPDYLIEKK